MSEFMSDPVEIRAMLQPFIERDIARWNGLALLREDALTNALGNPTELEQVALGSYPANRNTFDLETQGESLVGYVRHGEVILIEASAALDGSVLEMLGSPSAILPHEILAPAAYVHEYLYCERGLVLSVAEPFDKQQSLCVLRCRGIRPITSPREFGPEFYLAFEDRNVWQ